jgi:sulfate permease, SulP family
VDTIKILRGKHITILLSGVNPEIKEELKKHHLSDLIQDAFVFDNFKAATQKACEILECPAPQN